MNTVTQNLFEMSSMNDEIQMYKLWLFLRFSQTKQASGCCSFQLVLNQPFSLEVILGPQMSPKNLFGNVGARFFTDSFLPVFQTNSVKASKG